MKNSTIKIYLIADTHFNHKKMVEHQHRPNNFDELIWNSLNKLPADCTLIHLGDICMGDDDYVHALLSTLPYKKILIKGNHDKKTNTWYLKHGWDFVCEQLSDHYYGYYITFSHRPIEGIQNINIHGHLHSDKHREDEVKSFYKPKLHKLFSLEQANYKPISLEYFVKKMGS